MPKVSIEFCAKCKWHNRAIWYTQEILQTFSDPDVNLVTEVSVKPVHDQPGLFQVVCYGDSGVEKVIYRRKMKKATSPQSEEYYYDGFPDSKLLKQLIRNELFPQLGLGHVDGKTDLLAECKACETEE